jgi:SAM-dependent methyltransferase
MKSKVLHHYESIAGEFTELSNKYCNERYIKEIVKYIDGEMAVLEVGCGTGLFLSKLRARKRIGCDFSQGLLTQFKKEDIILVQADAEHLPFRENSFDVVYSINLLEHVPHPELAIREANRVLKKGGKLIIITPNGDIRLLLELADMLRLKAPEGPHRFLTSCRLRRLIQKQNMAVLKFKRFVIFPKGPRFMLDFFEVLERLFWFAGFFQLVVLEKR